MRYEYEQSKQLTGWDFYALIMAAMRQADMFNGRVLAEAYPEVWMELQERYNAPGGLLPGEI